MAMTGCFSSNLFDVRFQGMQGVKAFGGYRLLLSLRATIKKLPQDYERMIFSHLKGELNIGHKLIGTAIQNNHEQYELHKGYDHDDCPIHLSVDVSRSVIDEIEEFRNGGDLNLRLSLYAQCQYVGANAFERYLKEKETEKFPLENGTVSDHLEISLNQRDWSDVLEKMEYKRFQTFEVSFPVDDGSASEVISYIHVAQDYFFRGDYEGTLVNCRKALENFRASYNLDEDIKSAKADFCRNRKEREALELQQRIYVLYEAIQNICHIGHHPAGKAHGDSVRRNDAKLVLAMTGAVVSHCFGDSK